jgi:hypothetical protein
MAFQQISDAASHPGGVVGPLGSGALAILKRWRRSGDQGDDFHPGNQYGDRPTGSRCLLGKQLPPMRLTSYTWAISRGPYGFPPFLAKRLLPKGACG